MSDPQPPQPSPALQEAMDAARLAVHVTGTPEFRRWIVAHGKAQGLSTAAIARALGMKRHTLYRYEGDDPTPDFPGWEPSAPF